MPLLSKLLRALSRTERIVGVAAVSIMSASGLALVVVTVDAITFEAPARGGEYLEAIIGQPNAVNPILAESPADKALARLIFARLEHLADKIEALENPRQWRVRLKENLRWSSDRKITADDLVFTVQKIQDPETHSPLLPSWQGVSVQRVSELEAHFMTTAPYPFFEEQLRSLAPIPKYLFADTPPANWRLSDNLLQPVASGPFKVVDYEKRSSGFITEYHLAENPRYAGPRPYLERITFKFFPTSAETLSAFNAGAVQGIAGFGPDVTGSVNRPHAIWAFDIPGYYAIFLNQAKYAPFKEHAVRQALSIAVDRTELVRTIFGGHAEALAKPLRFPDDADDARSPQPDRKAATEILDNNDWRLGENGLRSRAGKTGTTTLVFALTVPEIPFLSATAQALAEQWKAIGVNVNVRSVSLGDDASKVITNRDYDALLYGNVLNPPQDLSAFWHSDERFAPGLNLAIYGDPQADALIERVRRDFVPESRMAGLREVNDLIARDVPAVFLYAPQYLFLTDKNVRGVGTAPIADLADRFAGVSAWYVKTARMLK